MSHSWFSLEFPISHLINVLQFDGDAMIGAVCLIIRHFADQRITQSLLGSDLTMVHRCSLPQSGHHE